MSDRGLPVKNLCSHKASGMMFSSFLLFMRAINQKHLVKQHRGKWIALKSDRRTVVASGKSVKSVLSAAQKKGCKKPIVTRVPRKPAHFIGQFLSV